jgi:hypothetical protein
MMHIIFKPVQNKFLTQISIHVPESAGYSEIMKIYLR